MVGEIDQWSLIAVVKECGSKTNKLPQQLNNVETNQTTSVVTNIVADGPDVNNYQTTSYILSLAGAVIPAPAEKSSCTSGDEVISALINPFLNPPRRILSPTITSPMLETNTRVVQLKSIIRRSGRIKSSPSKRGSSVADIRTLQQKKNFMKRVICYSNELDTIDRWGWRKYGQKLIKGSPFPRSYYRCSTVKGCKARKRVERSPFNPMLYINSYGFKHNHPYPDTRVVMGNRRAKRYAGSEMDPIIPNPQPESLGIIDSTQSEHDSKTGSDTNSDQTRAEDVSDTGSNVVQDDSNNMVQDDSNVVQIEDKHGNGVKEVSSSGTGEINNDMNVIYDVLIPNLIADWDRWAAKELLDQGGNTSSNIHYHHDNMSNNGLIHDPNVILDYETIERWLNNDTSIDINAYVPEPLDGSYEEMVTSMEQDFWII